MGLFIDNNYNITRFLVWVLVRLTVENVFLSGGSSLVDLNLDNLLFLNNFLSIASFAFVSFVNLFTSSVTISARSS